MVYLKVEPTGSLGIWLKYGGSGKRGIRDDSKVSGLSRDPNWGARRKNRFEGMESVNCTLFWTHFV